MHFPLHSITVRPQHCDPLFLLRELGLTRGYCALLESADRQGNNDFSFVALGARDVVTDVSSVFQKCADSGENATRLHMGYIGFISFEAARHFDTIDLIPDATIPDAVFVLPEILLKIDHAKREVTVISHKNSTEDIEEILRVINASPFHDDAKEKEQIVLAGLPLPMHEEIQSYRQTSRTEFCEAVRAIQEEILAGEVFQVVLSQELRLKNTIKPDLVYEQLRTINPSPYMYYFQTPERTIVGASPETLVRVEGRDILYRPIAGTRKRTGDAEKDKAMQLDLLHDVKERCEHQMLVDLGRNDIGRVAEIGSVKVINAFRIEQYAHVYHLVSDIVGRLRSDKTSFDAVKSVFPAGTLTGAPKIRAMEMIRRFEKTPRGIYGGAFGYVDLSGNLDVAITIRTMLFQGDVISLRVGAGIVKDSIPEREDDECLHKARSCLAALQRVSALSL
jgi:anthranilate synthase component 1